MEPDQSPTVPAAPQAGPVPPPSGPPPAPAPDPVRGVRRPVVLAAVAGGLTLLLLCCAGTGVVAFVGRDRIFGDPRGSTTITVEAVGRDGRVPDAETLERTRRMLADRAEAADLDDASVTRSGDRGIVVRVSGTDQAEPLRALVAVGELRFRQVIATAAAPPDTGPTGTQSSPPPETGPPPTLEQVIAKLGPAYEVAQSFARSLSPPEQAGALTRQVLAPFAALSPAEVAVLPAEVRYAVPMVTCTQLLARPAEPADAADQPSTTCDRSSPANKYLLAAAGLSGEDVKEATASVETQGEWVVTIRFTPAGQQRWTELSRTVSTGTGGTNRLAMVVDDVVLSAPTVQDVMTGDAQITGGFTRAEATGMASQLRSGALPVVLRIVELTSDPG
ncbi:hypothetical protein ACFP2T_08570 [Plantactinospora solaniradicis]|uniref:SecDF P1 head subdomain domain-containing protein n=1 Tax=Plantactinospora solaniradicis TaxID=1723736 RepID=A0ABW1K608_9ACTN